MSTIPHAIIDQFHYFITELLPIASCHENWDCEELHRACKWAKYCKTVYANLKLCNGTLSADSIGTTLQPLVTDMSIDEITTVLEDPVSALNKALMQNPFLSDQVFAEFMKINLSSQNAKDQFMKDTQRMASSRVTAIHLINSLRGHECESLQAEIEALYR